jgi:hypothetical protein
VEPRKQQELLRVMGNLRCSDESVDFWGSWNSVKASTLSFSYVKCDPTKRGTCKSEEEISQWLKNKYILFAYNDYVFN